MNKYVLLLFLCSASLVAQDAIVIDSLKQITYEEKLHDSIISKSYASLLRYYKRNNVDSCLVYFRRLKKYAKKTGDPKRVIYNYSRLGQEVVRLGKNEEALGYVQEAIKIAIKEDLWYEMAYIYGQTGELYSLGFNMTETALPFLLKSDSIYVANNFQGDKRGATLSYIGDVYSTFGNIEEARAYQEKALAIFKKSKNEFKQNLIFTKLANIEAKDKNYKKAIDYLLKSIAYYQDKKFPINEGICYTLLSDVYFENNEIEKAIDAGQTAIDLNKKNNYDYGLFLALVSQSNKFHENGNYAKSNELALQAESLGLALENYSNLEPVYEKLYLNSEKLGDFENAYKYSKEHKRVSDTVVAMQNIENAKELEAKYKNTQQEQEIQLLQSQNELVEEQKRNQRNLLFAIIGFVFLAGLVLYFLYRNKQKTNQKLKEIDTIKSNFFTNISHEFRTPLTLISGPIEKQLKNTRLETADRKDLEMVRRNSNRLLDLVDQLLDLSKLESGNLQLHIVKGNVSMLLRSLTGAFQYKAEKRGVQYIINIQEAKSTWFDADAIEKIVVNLLTNAFKYTPKRGTVRFSSAIQNNALSIEIENNGYIKGSKDIEAVFNRFYQADDSADGVGIGLALVKELVALYKGAIQVENTANNTVLFCIALPVEKHQFSEKEIYHGTYHSSAPTKETPSEVIDDSDAEISEIDTDVPILLVVEDNEDIRTFVTTTFEGTYRVLEAENGAEGIKQAIAFIPDIIISDIMMPEVDGFALCKHLKTDERTSHIPIILLTAKVEEQAQYEGLEMGADDYVLKPFKTKFLETRVKNLVTSRKQLRDRYSQEVLLKPKDIAISRIDEKFITKVQTILDTHLTNAGFTVEDFSKQLGMSRMQLHRKLKALTGLTASEFIRSQRLKLAASLLKESDVHVSEVCYQVGFNNPSYFTKCFKEVFGSLPSTYSQE